MNKFTSLSYRDPCFLQQLGFLVVIFHVDLKLLVSWNILLKEQMIVLFEVSNLTMTKWGTLAKKAQKGIRFRDIFMILIGGGTIELEEKLTPAPVFAKSEKVWLLG